MRGLYARSNMLRRKFYFCSDQVKNKLFSAYCNLLINLRSPRDWPSSGWVGRRSFAPVRVR